MTGSSPTESAVLNLASTAFASICGGHEVSDDDRAMARMFASTVLRQTVTLTAFGPDKACYGYAPEDADAWFALHYSAGLHPRVVIAVHLPDGKLKGDWQYWLAPSGNPIAILNGRMQTVNSIYGGQALLRDLLAAVRAAPYVNEVLEAALDTHNCSPQERRVAELLVQAALNLAFEDRMAVFRRRAGSFYGLRPRGLNRTYLGLGIVQPNGDSTVRVCLQAWVAFGRRRGRLELWFDDQQQLRITRDGQAYFGVNRNDLEGFVTIVATQVLHPWNKALW